MFFGVPLMLRAFASLIGWVSWDPGYYLGTAHPIIPTSSPPSLF